MSLTHTPSTRRCRCLIAMALGIMLNMPAGMRAQDLESRVVEYTLDNGMQFLLIQRSGAPVFSGYIRFRVGSIDEHDGITGLAHIFEHMAFKGTPVIGTTDYEAEKPLIAETNTLGAALSAELGKGLEADSAHLEALQEQLADAQERHKEYIRTNEFFNLYDRHGGTGMNATTGVDLTTYFVSLPANRLEVWMLMESERLRYPVLREFYSERDVVMEERRLRTDNSPFGKLYEQFMAAAFTSHAYQNPVIGWMSDLRTVTHTEAEAFYAAHYSPANAVAAIVGDIDIARTKQLIDQYFAEIPRRQEAPTVRTVEPQQEGERRIRVLYPANPIIITGYHKPTLPHYDDYVFDVIHSLLSSGRTSRLYESLIKEKQVAVQATSAQGLPGARGNNLFVLYGVPRHPHTVDDLEAAFTVELDRLKNEPVSERELQKVRNQIDAGAIRSLASNGGLASQLTYFQLLAGDWRYILEQRETFKSVTPEDIMRVAQQYLVEKNKTVAILVDNRVSRQ